MITVVPEMLLGLVDLPLLGENAGGWDDFTVVVVGTRSTKHATATKSTRGRLAACGTSHECSEG